MTETQGLTVFIPVYNEEAVLEANLRTLFRFLDGFGAPCEVLVASNGSTDATVGILEKIAVDLPRLRFFHLPEKGVGAAFKEGVRMGSFEYLVTVDMDLSINLDFILQAHELLGSHELVIGSKITGDQQRSALRKAASGAFIALAKSLLGIGFHDYSIAAKAYRRDMVERYIHRMDDLTFYVVQLVFHAHRDGARIIEVPVSCRDTRGSRFNLLHEGFYKFGKLFLLWLRER